MEKHVSSECVYSHRRKGKRIQVQACHINDTSASDMRITPDRRLPRPRCLSGRGPSRRRSHCQRTVRSFGKPWQQPAFFALKLFLNLSARFRRLASGAPSGGRGRRAKIVCKERKWWCVGVLLMCLAYTETVHVREITARAFQ